MWSGSGLDLKPGMLLRLNPGYRRKTYPIMTSGSVGHAYILPTDVLLVLRIFVEGDTIHGTGWTDGSVVAEVLHGDQVRHTWVDHRDNGMGKASDVFEEV